VHCSKQTASKVIGAYYYMCGPVPSNTSHATSTQHLVIGENAIFYSTLFDLTSYSFDFPTVLSTTGSFPKPASFRSLAYQSRMNGQVSVSSSAGRGVDLPYQEAASHRDDANAIYHTTGAQQLRRGHHCDLQEQGMEPAVLMPSLGGKARQGP